MALDLYTKFTTKRAEKNSSLKTADLYHDANCASAT